MNQSEVIIKNGLNPPCFYSYIHNKVLTLNFSLNFRGRLVIKLCFKTLKRRSYTDRPHKVAIIFMTWTKYACNDNHNDHLKWVFKRTMRDNLTKLCDHYNRSVTKMFGAL